MSLNMVFVMGLLLSSSFLFWCLTNATTIAYRCGAGNMKVSAISTVDLPSCEKPSSIIVEKHRIQLLQLTTLETTQVIQCKVSITRRITSCNNTAFIPYPIADFIHNLDFQQCMSAHNSGKLTIGKTTITNLEKWTKTYPALLAGEGSFMNCTGEKYEDDYGKYNNVLVTATVKVTLREYEATVNLKTNKITFDDYSSTTFTDGQYTHPDYGNTFWYLTSRDIKCTDNYFIQLYEGTAEKAITAEEVFYTIKSPSVNITIGQRGTSYVCSTMLYSTEHPILYIVDQTDGGTFLENLHHHRSLNVNHANLYTYLDTKLLNMQHLIKQEMTGLYEHILKERCELENRVLQNSLSLATIAPDLFAYTIKKGPGYMAVPAGEIIYITQCTPVEVKVRHDGKCYNFLPVSHGNESLFRTPKTHILTSRAATIECTAALAPSFKIDDKWWKMNPIPEENVRPETISFNKTTPKWQFKNIDQLMDTGIYTQEMVTALEKKVNSGMEHQQVLSELSERVVRKNNGSKPASMINLLDNKDYDNIAENTWDRTFGRFITFGSVSAGFFGLYVVLRISKWVMDSCIHGYTLYNYYGWSLKLLGAFCDSITNLLVHLHVWKIQKQEEEQNSDDDNDDDGHHHDDHDRDPNTINNLHPTANNNDVEGNSGGGGGGGGNGGGGDDKNDDDDDHGNANPDETKVNKLTSSSSSSSSTTTTTTVNMSEPQVVIVPKSHHNNDNATIITVAQIEQPSAPPLLSDEKLQRANNPYCNTQYELQYMRNQMAALDYNN